MLFLCDGRNRRVAVHQSLFFNIPILLDDFEKSESETSVIMGNVVKLLLEVEPTSY